MSKNVYVGSEGSLGPFPVRVRESKRRKKFFSENFANFRYLLRVGFSCGIAAAFGFPANAKGPLSKTHLGTHREREGKLVEKSRRKK